MLGGKVQVLLFESLAEFMQEHELGGSGALWGAHLGQSDRRKQLDPGLYIMHVPTKIVLAAALKQLLAQSTEPVSDVQWSLICS